MSISTTSNRLDLTIDVFTLPNQKAMALPNLTPRELIGAILQEFKELEYLGQDEDEYLLETFKSKDDRLPLNALEPLGEQVAHGAHLVLSEKPRSRPSNTTPPPQMAYLRDMSANGHAVFRLDWLPAIIGRPDPTRIQNEQVTVNLQSFEQGLRVSRRHVRIVAEGDKFYIESLANNPTRVNDAPLYNRTHLQHGDIILLERSNIKLKFILRESLRPVDARDDEE